MGYKGDVRPRPPEKYPRYHSPPVQQCVLVCRRGPLPVASHASAVKIALYPRLLVPSTNQLTINLYFVLVYHEGVASGMGSTSLPESVETTYAHEQMKLVIARWISAN